MSTKLFALLLDAAIGYKDKAIFSASAKTELADAIQLLPPYTYHIQELDNNLIAVWRYPVWAKEYARWQKASQEMEERNKIRNQRNDLLDKLVGLLVSKLKFSPTTAKQFAIDGLDLDETLLAKLGLTSEELAQLANYQQEKHKIL